MNINLISVRRTEDSEELARLSKHTDHFVRVAVASNVHTSSSVLKILAHDPATGVRAGVAGNKNTSSSVLSDMGLKTDIEDSRN